jgi:hypothetical protein
MPTLSIRSTPAFRKYFRVAGQRNRPNINSLPPLQTEAVATGCEAMRVSNRSNCTVRAGLSQELLSRLAQLRELQRVPILRPGGQK